MELQIKTAMQMRDQGHALKQKALDLVAEAELKVRTSTFTRWNERTNEQRWMATKLLIVNEIATYDTLVLPDKQSAR